MSALERMNFSRQTVEDSYAEPANFLEIDVSNPQTYGEGRNRYTDYEVRMRVSWASVLGLRYNVGISFLI